MKNYFFTLLFLMAGLQLAIAQNELFENQLYDLPDVVFAKIETAKDYESSYELRIKQPIDHENPSKGYFYQRAFLSHKGYDRPTVIITQGYTRTRNHIGELAEYIDANQIDVEHRYFGESMPDSLDYKYLNLKQATADLHHIREVFGQIYAGKWVSTGISKGGATTIFYRYYYPNDVDVSVPYVAPINREVEDQRLYRFLETVGSDECREKIRDFQERILSEREEVLPLLQFYSLGAKVKFSYHTFEEAFEYTVLEYPFSFWQYGQDCAKIPDEKASVAEMLAYLLSVSDISFFGDKQVEQYGSHYYQSAQEMGYYGYETSKFEGLLIALPNDQNPQATFVPNKMEVNFDGQLLKEVNEWLKNGVDRMVYINGALDTWSATAVPENDKGDSEWFFMEGMHHGTARIKNMTTSEKERFRTAMEKWLSIEIAE